MECVFAGGDVCALQVTVTVKEEEVARNRKLDLKKRIPGLGYGCQFSILDRPFGIEIRGGTPVNRYHFVLRNRYHLFASYYKKLRVMLC